MKISTVALQTFCSELWRCAYEKLPDDKKKLHTVLNDTVLHKIVEVEGKKLSIFDHVFGHCAIANDHFERKLATLETSKGELTSLKPSVFIAGCEFIGISYEDASKTLVLDYEPDNKPSSQAEILKIVFLKRYSLDNISDGSDIYQTLPIIKSNNTQTFLSQNNNSNSMKYNVDKIVHEFYQNISGGKYQAAWGLLSDKFHKRAWKDKFEDFETGYTNLLGISNLNVWDIVIEGNNAECKVFYNEKIATRTSAELGNLDKLTVANLDEYVGQMKKIIEKAKQTDLIDFENVELSKFFEPDVSEYIWIHCGLVIDNITDLFPREVTVTVSRLYNIICLENDNIWKINSILPIKNYNYR